jgi:hypothetical protein
MRFRVLKNAITFLFRKVGGLPASTRNSKNINTGLDPRMMGHRYAVHRMMGCLEKFL